MWAVRREVLDQPVGMRLRTYVSIHVDRKCAPNAICDRGFEIIWCELPELDFYHRCRYGVTDRSGQKQQGYWQLE